MKTVVNMETYNVKRVVMLRKEGTLSNIEQMSALTGRLHALTVDKGFRKST